MYLFTKLYFDFVVRITYMDAEKIKKTYRSSNNKDRLRDYFFVEIGNKQILLLKKKRNLGLLIAKTDLP